MTARTENIPAESRHGAMEVNTQDTTQFVTFYFNKHFFGLPIDDVIEINRTLATTPVPLAPDYAAGVVNLRGHILTAVHLGRRIGLKTSTEENQNFHNVIMGNREEPISLLVERIGDVMAVPRNQVESPPDLIEGIDVKFVSHVCQLPNQLLIILNTSALERPPQTYNRGGQA